jgi:hypothetical protein
MLQHYFFVWLNSNFGLNSFEWFWFEEKKENPFPLPPLPFSGPAHLSSLSLPCVAAAFGPPEAQPTSTAPLLSP